MPQRKKKKRKSGIQPEEGTNLTVPSQRPWPRPSLSSWCRPWFMTKPQSKFGWRGCSCRVRLNVGTGRAYERRTRSGSNWRAGWEVEAKASKLELRITMLHVLDGWSSYCAAKILPNLISASCWIPVWLAQIGIRFVGGRFSAAGPCPQPAVTAHLYPDKAQPGLVTGVGQATLDSMPRVELSAQLIADARQPALVSVKSRDRSRLLNVHGMIPTPDVIAINTP